MPTSPARPETDPFPPAPLLALAPLRLPNHRRVRYAGDDLCIAMDQLADRDAALLRRLYQRLNELLFTLADTSTTDVQKWEQVQSWVERYESCRLSA